MRVLTRLRMEFDPRLAKRPDYNHPQSGGFDVLGAQAEPMKISYLIDFLLGDYPKEMYERSHDPVRHRVPRRVQQGSSTVGQDGVPRGGRTPEGHG